MAATGYETERFDHLGSVAGICREIGPGRDLDAVDERQHQWVSVGTATVALILNGLGVSSRRLYLVWQVFIHAEACEGYTTPDHYPDGFRHRRQLLRAYTADGRIADATIAEHGNEAEQMCAAFFARPDIAYMHSRNVLYGCYMYTIRRPV
jgi:hypothetical protein